jgi:serine/threonine protein kinase
VSCLGSNTVLALVDGRLKGTDLATATEHLASCDVCADRVAAADSGNLPQAKRVGAWSDALAPGTMIGERHVILDLAGRGAMGEVYKAYDRRLDCNVALKLMRVGGTGSRAAEARARLLGEGKKLARVSHPNVVAVRDADEVYGRVFLSMEFIEGKTLGAWLAEQPRSWSEVRSVFIAAGRGLEAAHQAGVVHRDFKPQNVMIGGDGRVRIMDFGLAELSSENAEVGEALSVLDGIVSDETVALTRTGMLVGTPYYMAPEQFLGQTDARSDQFSFCVALYHALYGEWPFPVPVASLAVLREAVMAGRLREPPVGTRVPQRLRRVLMRGLEPDRSRRFPSMAHLLQALGDDPGRPYRRVATVVALVAVAVAGALTIRLWVGRPLWP